MNKGDVNNMETKDFYNTKVFECPVTRKPIKGTYFPTLNELKFSINFDWDVDKCWDTTKWCMESDTSVIGGVESANLHLEKLGLDTKEIYFS
jgi:hypothetical protein